MLECSKENNLLVINYKYLYTSKSPTMSIHVLYPKDKEINEHVVENIVDEFEPVKNIKILGWELDKCLLKIK